MTEFQNGYVATRQGREYEARPAEDGSIRLYSPEPVPGFEPVTAGRHLLVAQPGELEALWYVRTTCVWQGARFTVIGAHGSWLRLELLEPDEAAAQRLGLERFDIGVYQGWAARKDVAEVRQEQL